MKKFLGILVIAGTLVACNNSADGSDATADSLKADSIKKAQQDSINAQTPTMPTSGSDSASTTPSTTTGGDSSNRSGKDSTRK